MKFFTKVFKSSLIADVLFGIGIRRFLIDNDILQRSVRHRVFAHLKMQKRYSPGFIRLFSHRSTRMRILLGGANKKKPYVYSMSICFWFINPTPIIFEIILGRHVKIHMI